MLSGISSDGKISVKDPNKNNAIRNMNYTNSNTKFDFYNHINNMHPFNFKTFTNNNSNDIPMVTHRENKITKTEIKHQDDKSLIEFLLGKSNDDEPPKKDKKNNKNKETKNIKKKRINIHDKRKEIKFSIAKTNT